MPHSARDRVVTRPTKKQPVIGLDMNKRNNADDRGYQYPEYVRDSGQLSCHRHLAMAGSIRYWLRRRMSVVGSVNLTWRTGATSFNPEDDYPTAYKFALIASYLGFNNLDKSRR
jgi:hypothetical protein